MVTVPAECTAENGYEWAEREQRTMVGRDEKGTLFLKLMEAVEIDVETAR